MTSGACDCDDCRDDRLMEQVEAAWKDDRTLLDAFYLFMAGKSTEESAAWVRQRMNADDIEAVRKALIEEIRYQEARARAANKADMAALNREYRDE